MHASLESWKSSVQFLVQIKSFLLKYYIYSVCLRGYRLQLKTVNFQGQYVGVMGTVGSGKSSLLSALLAELNKESGIIALSDLDRGMEKYSLFN